MNLKVFINCTWVLLEVENVLPENSMTMMYTKEPVDIFVNDFSNIKRPTKHISFIFVIFAI